MRKRAWYVGVEEFLLAAAMTLSGLFLPLALACPTVAVVGVAYSNVALFSFYNQESDWHSLCYVSSLLSDFGIYISSLLSDFSKKHSGQEISGSWICHPNEQMFCDCYE